MRYVTLEDPRAAQLKVIRMDRRWFPARKCKRDDALGHLALRRASVAGPARAGVEPASTQFAKTGDPRIDRLAPSLVMVNFDMPYSVSGVTEKNYHGTGVIVDAAARPGGDRPQYRAGRDGRCAHHLRRHGRGAGQGGVHPSAAQSRRGLLRPEVDRRHAGARRHAAHQGARARATMCGWSGSARDSKIMSQQTQVSSVDAVSFPLSRTLRFRDSNLEAVSLINPPGDYDGVLADEKGDVLALWSSFAFESQRELEQVNRGIPADLVAEMLGVVADGRPLYSFEAEFDVQSLAGARELGLPDEWVRRFEEHDPQRRQVLGIDRLVAGSPAAALLEPGDLLLAIDGKVVNRFREVERAVQKPEVTVTRLARRRREDPADEDRGAEWPRHRSGADLGGRDAAGAASRHGGAARHRALRRVRVVLLLRLARRRTTACMPAGASPKSTGSRRPISMPSSRRCSGKPDRASLRLKTVSWNGQTDVITLKLDKHYWPAYELDRQNDGSWTRTALDPPEVTAALAP